VKKNWLWIFVSIFIALWVGPQLFEALFNGKIVNIRTNEVVYYAEDPVWFVIIFILKVLFFIGSLYYLITNLFGIKLWNKKSN